MPRTLSTEPYKVLLEKLREVRACQGMTQEALAGVLDFRQSDVSKVERGVRRLDMIELRQWLGALEYPFLDFVRELDERLKVHEALQQASRSTLKAGPGRRSR